jgi:hypothetical protein
MRNIVWVPAYDPDYNRRAMDEVAKALLKNENKRGDVTYEINPVKVDRLKTNDVKWVNTWGSRGSGYLETERDKAVKAIEEFKMSDDNKPDFVNHPPHYTQHPSGVECIQVTEHFNFCRGNAIKYIWRAGEKGSEIEDLKKAAWYINREIARLEKQREVPT